MASDLNVVLLGYGLAGQVFHGPLVHSTPGLRVAAIVTANPERVSKARADFPEARILATADDAWAAASDFDLAVIGTANVTHVPFALAALDHGLHVVVDKPVAATADEAQRIADHAAAVGRQALPFQNRRWDTEYLAVRSIIDSGRIGTVHRLDSRMERLRIAPKGTWRESTDVAQMGGVLYDFGAHQVDQAIELLGPVVRVTCVARAARFPGNADDDALWTLEHASGAVSSLVASQAAPVAGPRFLVNASKGGIRVEYADGQEAQLKAGLRPGDAGWGVESEAAQIHVTVVDDDGVVSESLERPAVGRWDSVYAGIRDAILGIAPAPVPMSDAIANLRVLDASRASVATGREIELSQAAAHG